MSRMQTTGGCDVRYVNGQYTGDGFVFYEKGKPRVYYLERLQKTDKQSGGEVLHCVEQHISRQLGGGLLTLQDSSNIECGDKQESGYYLGFRHMLKWGKTWYESRGYSVTGTRNVRKRDSVATAIREYTAMPVAPIAQAIRRQVETLRRSPTSSWAIVSGALNDASAVGVPVSDAKNQDIVSQMQYKAGGTAAFGRKLMKQRERLAVLLESAPRGAALGPWLVSLSCTDYAYFMSSMYGPLFNMLTERHPVPLARVGSTRTPTFGLYRRANALGRDYGVVWAKQIS